MFSRLLAKRGRGRSGRVKRPLQEAICQPLEDRLLLSKTIYVDVNSPAPATNGPTWDTAYKDLQLALGVAVSGDTIKVADGTYKPTATLTRTFSFALKTGVGLYGGYAGYGAADPDARDVTLYPAILSGDIGTVGTKTDNSYHVVVGSGTSTSAILDGFTITAGNANSGSDIYGGGMYNATGSPTVTNCTFTGNSASSLGGGIYNSSGSPTLADCTFSGNTSSTYGGGMYNSSSSPTLTNCTFSGNTALSGGGMFNNNSSSAPTLTHCTFSGNTALNASGDSWGGGMVCDQGSAPTLRNCIFSGNSATTTYAARASLGGGMYSINGAPTLTDCVFLRNTVTSTTGPSYGGGFYAYGGSAPKLINCVFQGNTATSTSGPVWGGGMYDNSSSRLTNCTFSGNTAAGTFGAGGGMYNNSAAVLTNCTFTRNTAIGNGGGLYDSVAPTLVNCIIWNNTAASGSQLYPTGSTATISYSDIQGGFTGTGNINTDPLFVRNPSPGADTKWGTNDDDYGDLRLQIWSTAVDAGNSGASGLTGVTTDLGGGGRFLDVPTTPDTGAGTTPIVDMGAYEVVPALVASAGGPYVGIQGRGLTLSGRGASTVAGTLQYAWEWTGNGAFDDATGTNPSFPTSIWGALTSVPVSLRVTDSVGSTVVDSTTVQIVPPLFVDDTATGANNGTSWADAYQDLQTALAAATAGQTILVGPGTYKPSATGDRAASFALKTGVAIYGGYAGFGAADPFARNIGLYPSILSGDIGTVGSTTDNSYHVVVGSGTNSTAVLDGFTITAGNANGTSPTDSGGGMYSSSGSPTLANCTFSGNMATANAGGMFNSSSSSPSLTNCTFVGNSAAGTSGAGGGLYNNSTSNPVLINCVFRGNIATYEGAGMMNTNSSAPQLTNCTFVGNTVTGTTSGYAYGGAIYNSSSSPALTNCTLAGNTVVGSSLAYGGAIYNSSSSPTLANCILWGNTATNGAQIYQSSGTTTATYSDIQGSFSGTGNKAVDPLFIRNPSAGADGTWGTADDDLGDLRLRLISTVIDAGNNAAIASSITTDVAGNPRRQNIAGITDTGSGTAPIVDTGAYEANASPQALAGGPYTVLENFVITLTGTGYSDKGLTLSYAWDLDADGLYDDATDASTPFSALGITGPQTRVISLRVTDASGASVFDTTTVLVDRPLYVDDTATGANNGTTWGNAYTSLLTALTAATAGQTILVGQGTYKPSTSNRSVSFALKTGVAIYGGYAGAGALAPYDRDVRRYPSILSGDIGTVGSNTDNSYSVVKATSTTSSAILDGFTITGGNGSYGGGMYIGGGNPTVRNCAFNGNTASSGGGGMYISSASPTIVNCTFSANSSTSYGGGMYNSSSSPTVVNCTFTMNSASTFYYGGGMYNLDGTPVVTNCVFWGNTAGDSAQVSGTGTFTYCDVQGSWFGSSGTGNISTDPLFIRNPGPGTDATWGTADDDFGDLRLRVTSPVIDAGSNAAIPSGITTDLVGNPRRQDIASRTDTGSGTAPIVDLGAYELNPGPLPLIGGPYWMLEGASLVLSAVAYSGSGLTMSYAWDFDADGLYDDATGPNPSFSAIGIQGPQTRVITLRVTDSSGASALDTTTLSIVHPIYVDDSATGANNGTSWTNAYRDLKTALSAATAGKMIVVGQGTYKPSATGDRMASFALKTGVTVYGGYAGVGATDPYARDVRRYSSILSGDIGTVGSNNDNSYHVVVGSNTNYTAVLDGFTITAGNASGTYSPLWFGGGMYNENGSPTLANCTFLVNSAGSGGGMYNTSSKPTLSNCTFNGNTAVGTPGSGGGMYNASSSPSLTNCVFSGNAVTNTVWSGGGIYNDSGSPTLVNCTFSGNTAPSGGAISNSFGSMVLTNCILWGNNGLLNLPFSTVTYSDLPGSWSGNYNADPLFVRNPSPGADGQWGTADDDYGDLRIGSLTSPVVDAGNNAAIPTGVTTDLAGNPRFVDIPQKTNTGLGTSPIVDIGAYERGPVATTISGTAGDDTLCLRLSANRTTLDVFNGLTATGQPAATYTLQSGDASIFIDPGAGSDTVVLTGFASGDRANFQSTFTALNSIVLAGANVETLLLDAPADSAMQLAALSVGRAVTLSTGKNITLRVPLLSITGTGSSLDLAGNSLILDYSTSPMAQVRAWLCNGRMGSTPAIKGSAGLGMVDNALVHLSSFAGQTLGGFGQILIQATVAGDTNLDGKVDEADYLNIIANMGRTNSQWFLGDLNHDGVVTADDLAEVTANFGVGAAFAAGPGLLAPAVSAKPVAAKAVVKKKVQGVKSSKVQGGKNPTHAVVKAKVKGKAKG